MQKNIFKDKIIPSLMLVFVIIGLSSAIFLTNLYYNDASSDTFCDVNETISCTNLAQSEYSDIGPIPIAVMGLAAYLLFLVLAIFLLFPKLPLKICPCGTRKNLAKVMLFFTSVGMLFTVYLIAVEIVVKIFCLGCLVSWIATACLWVLAIILYHKV